MVMKIYSKWKMDSAAELAVKNWYVQKKSKNDPSTGSRYLGGSTLPRATNTYSGAHLVWPRKGPGWASNGRRMGSRGIPRGPRGIPRGSLGIHQVDPPGDPPGGSLAQSGSLRDLGRANSR